MSTGKSAPGPSPQRPGADNPAFMQALAALEQDVENTTQRKAAAKKARSDEETAAGVSRAALNMRQRRKRADVQAQERKAIAARDKAFRILARNHAEEYRSIMQECRKALGLPPALPRGQHQRIERTVEVTPQHPAQPQKQEACQHGSYPVNKLPYGKFCGNCGTKL